MDRMTNEKFAKQKHFIELCEDLGVKPTTRQASKYRRDKGLLWHRMKGRTHYGVNCYGTATPLPQQT